MRLLCRSRRVALVALILFVASSTAVIVGNGTTFRNFIPTSSSQGPTQTGAGSGTLPGTWRSTGPTSFGSNSMGVGRVNAIALDPVTPGLIYLGAASGGVWRSYDNGLTWTPLTDTQTTLQVSSIAIDPTGIVYVGTGDFDTRSNRGIGILKSTDHGNSWLDHGSVQFGDSPIGSIVVNRSNRNYLLAGSESGLFNSTNAGVSWSMAHWSDGTLAGGGGRGVQSIVPDSTNAMVFYAIIDSTLAKSVDGGATWTRMGNWIFTDNYARLATSLAAPNQLFAEVDTCNTSGACGTLFKDSDTTNPASAFQQVGPAGAGFCAKPVPPGQPPYNQCFYDMFISVDPVSANIIYVGGLDIVESSNGGVDWPYACPSVSCPSAIHVDFHAFAFDPSDHNKIYVSEMMAGSLAPTEIILLVQASAGRILTVT